MQKFKSFKLCSGETAFRATVPCRGEDAVLVRRPAGVVGWWVRANGISPGGIGRPLLAYMAQEIWPDVNEEQIAA